MTNADERTYSSPELTQTQHVWREGDRIRARDGMGYGDAVPDSHLEGYAGDPGLHPYDRTFAAAVLAIRKFERAAQLAHHPQHNI